MKAQLAPFDIGIIMMILLVAAIITIFFWEGFHIFTKTVVIDMIYDTNEANLMLLSLLPLNYSDSKTVYEKISLSEYYPIDKNFVDYLNSTIFKMFEKEPKCYKLSLDSKLLVSYREEYCDDTKYNAKVLIFVPYSNGNIIKYLYLNYNR